MHNMLDIKLETTHTIHLSTEQVHLAIREYVRKNFSDNQNYKITHIQCFSFGEGCSASVKLEEKK